MLSGETAPTRPFPGGFDLTPISRDVNNFRMHYHLNLVPIDEENRRHFQQQDDDLLIKIRRHIPLLIGYLHTRPRCSGYPRYVWTRYAGSVGLTMLPSELEDAAFGLLLHLTLDYVLCACFFVFRSPRLTR